MTDKELELHALEWAWREAQKQALRVKTTHREYMRRHEYADALWRLYNRKREETRHA